MMLCSSELLILLPFSISIAHCKIIPYANLQLSTYYYTASHEGSVGDISGKICGTVEYAF